MSDTSSTLASELDAALSADQIVAFFQPQLDLHTGRVVAAESLARWIHPERGLVPPGVFIPLAEEADLIVPIGERMLHLACQAAMKWQTTEMTLEVAVNVSATQLHQPNFADSLLETVTSYGLDPGVLIVEVTESTAIMDLTSVAQRLDWLRSVGVTISVDDFGTGHSSVEQVLGLHATELKIDQSLVQDENLAARTLLSAVVGFAHDKGLRVVAEGIETEAQLQRVRELKCDRGQGYLLAMPMPEADMDALVLAKNA